jgi:hypothetical protein
MRQASITGTHRQIHIGIHKNSWGRERCPVAAAAVQLRIESSFEPNLDGGSDAKLMCDLDVAVRGAVVQNKESQLKGKPQLKREAAVERKDAVVCQSNLNKKESLDLLILDAT